MELMRLIDIGGLLNFGLDVEVAVGVEPRDLQVEFGAVSTATSIRLRSHS